MLAINDIGTKIVPTKAKADAPRASNRDRLLATIPAKPLKTATRDSDFSLSFSSCSFDEIKVWYRVGPACQCFPLFERSQRQVYGLQVAPVVVNSALHRDQVAPAFFDPVDLGSRERSVDGTGARREGLTVYTYTA